MAVVSTTTLKTYFETGDRPTEANFIDLIDTLSALPASSAPTSISEITQALPFTGNQVMGIDDRDVQSGAYSFTLAAGGTPGYVIQVYIQADGSNTFTFSSDFTILNSSITNGGTLTADVTYQFWFFFDGDKASVNVVETNAAAIDVTAPTLSTTTIENATDSVLDLVFNEAVTITTAGWSIATDGAALSISAVASGSGTTTPKFTLSRSVLSTETVTVSYASSTGNTVDGSGNELADITDRAVTNNVGFVPSDLDNKVFWLPITTATVTTGTGGISQADDSFNANNFTQGTSGNRPDLVTAETLDWGDFVNTNTDYLISPSTFQTEFRSPFSLVCRLKPDDGQLGSGLGQFIFGVASGTAPASDFITFSLYDAGFLRVIYKAGGNSTVADTNTAVFTNGAQATYKVVVLTFDTSLIKIYVDGTLQTLNATFDGDMSGVTMSSYTSANAPYIGDRNYPGQSAPFNGLIGDVMMFSDAITQSEVTRLTTYLGK